MFVVSTCTELDNHQFPETKRLALAYPSLTKGIDGGAREGTVDEEMEQISGLEMRL